MISHDPLGIQDALKSSYNIIWTGENSWSTKGNDDANGHGSNTKNQTDHPDRTLSSDRYPPNDHQSYREWECNSLTLDTRTSFNGCGAQRFGLGSSIRRVRSFRSYSVAFLSPQSLTHEGPQRAPFSFSPTPQYHHNIDYRCRNQVRGQGYEITLMSLNDNEGSYHLPTQCPPVVFLKNNRVVRS